MATAADITIRVHDQATAALRRIARGLTATRAWPWSETLTATAFIGGWLLITAGIAALTSRVAWLFSLGVLLISLGGWRLLWRMATDGLYALTREERDG